MEPDLKGLILEGTAGTGKTSVLRSMLTSPEWTGRSNTSSLVLSEHQTMRVLESKRGSGTLTLQDHLEILGSIVEMLETFQHRLEAMEWARRNRKNHQLHYVLERFHLSHLFHYENLEWGDTATIDERLRRLNARLCILTINQPAMRRRITGDQSKQWQGYLRSIGSTEAEIIAYFTRQQEQLLALCERTVLPVLVIDTSELPLKAVTAEVLRYFLGVPT